MFAYDFVRMHFLMIYTDLIEYNIVGDTKTLLFWFIPFISKLKSGDIINTGQCMSNQTFSNLQFRLLLQSCFYIIHIDWRNTSGARKPFVYFDDTWPVLMLIKPSNFHF